MFYPERSILEYYCGIEVTIATFFLFYLFVSLFESAVICIDRLVSI